MKELLEYAQRKLEEADRNGSDHDILYWAAYLDGVKAAERRASHEHEKAC